MIITLNIESENNYYKIFKAVNIAFTKLGVNNTKRKGKPNKYSNQQIVACMLYGVKNSIFSLRELEYRIREDHIFQTIINLKEVPDYSTLSLRAVALEKHIYYGIYTMIFIL